jgi:hypothetical protein
MAHCLHTVFNRSLFVRPLDHCIARLGEILSILAYSPVRPTES